MGVVEVSVGSWRRLWCGVAAERGGAGRLMRGPWSRLGATQGPGEQAFMVWSWGEPRACLGRGGADGGLGWPE